MTVTPLPPVYGTCDARAVDLGYVWWLECILAAGHDGPHEDRIREISVAWTTAPDRDEL
jgi:hypothetical protein